MMAGCKEIIERKSQRYRNFPTGEDRKDDDNENSDYFSSSCLVEDICTLLTRHSAGAFS